MGTSVQKGCSTVTGVSAANGQPQWLGNSCLVMWGKIETAGTLQPEEAKYQGNLINVYKNQMKGIKMAQ